MITLSIDVQGANRRSISFVNHLVTGLQISQSVPATVDWPQVVRFGMPGDDESPCVQANQNRLAVFQR